MPKTGCVVSAEAVGRPSGVSGASVQRRAAASCVAARPVPGALAVRNRRPGDRFRPLGLGGRKKLQDFFVDRKVPAQSADRVPLVVDEADRIVWVAGYAIDEEFRVTDPAQAVVILRLKAVGRLCLNSTLKSLLFWMVLVVVGVLIWNFSTKFQQQRASGHVQRVHARGSKPAHVARVDDHRAGNHRHHQGQRARSTPTRRASTKASPTS